jgi:anti-sigma B factor antagonist
MPGFHVSEREVPAGCREIRVEGELDLAVAGQLQEAIARCHGEQTLIDLADCDFIDSTGIAVIVRAHNEWAEEGGGRLVVHSARDQVLRVLTTTGLTGIGLIFESREEALAVPALHE